MQSSPCVLCHTLVVLVASQVATSAPETLWKRRTLVFGFPRFTGSFLNNLMESLSCSACTSFLKRCTRLVASLGSDLSRPKVELVGHLETLCCFLLQALVSSLWLCECGGFNCLYSSCYIFCPSLRRWKPFLFEKNESKIRRGLGSTRDSEGTVVVSSKVYAISTNRSLNSICIVESVLYLT